MNDSFSDIGSATGTSGLPLTGTFAPEAGALLSVFNGLDASGEWRLSITDAGGDTGTLFNWSLHFTF